MLAPGLLPGDPDGESTNGSTTVYSTTVYSTTSSTTVYSTTSSSHTHSSSCVDMLAPGLLLQGDPDGESTNGSTAVYSTTCRRYNVFVTRGSDTLYRKSSCATWGRKRIAEQNNKHSKAFACLSGTEGVKSQNHLYHLKNN
ncbi:hypothetical protein FKM82_020229 [Ascaphus truei]